MNSNGPSKERHCWGRYTLGPLGYGWTDNWQWSATTDNADGTVTIITPDGQRRIFQPDSRQPHHYISQPGDQATLLLSGDSKSYTLLETDGTLRAFSVSDGSLQYVADADGNRITLAYSNGHLTKLTHSSGQWLQIGYSSDRITSLTDSVGRKTVFSYDANQQLRSVQYYDGRTITYDYYNGGGCSRRTRNEDRHFAGQRPRELRL